MGAVEHLKTLCCLGLPAESAMIAVTPLLHEIIPHGWTRSPTSRRCHRRSPQGFGATGRRGSQKADVPFALGLTLGNLGEGGIRPSRMWSIHPRALAIAVSRASRLSGLIAGFAQRA
jgi:hypothetical protein